MYSFEYVNIQQGVLFARMVMMELNERLRKVRNDMGLTQVDFAELGGVKVLAQTNYERGLRVPSLEYLLKLKEAGVDINYIIFGEVVDINRLSSIEHKLLFAYQNASKERKKAIEFVAGIYNDDDSSDDNKEGLSDHHSCEKQNKEKNNNSFFSAYSWGDIRRNTFNLIFKVVPVFSLIAILFLFSIQSLITISLFSESKFFSNFISLGLVVIALLSITFGSIKIGEKLLNYKDSNLVRLRQLRALFAK